MNVRKVQAAGIFASHRAMTKRSVAILMALLGFWPHTVSGSNTARGGFLQRVTDMAEEVLQDQNLCCFAASAAVCGAASLCYVQGPASTTCCCISAAAAYQVYQQVPEAKSGGIGMQWDRNSGCIVAGAAAIDDTTGKGIGGIVKYGRNGPGWSLQYNAEGGGNLGNVRSIASAVFNQQFMSGPGGSASAEDNDEVRARNKREQERGQNHDEPERGQNPEQQ
ncbi:unnamed protein product [Amoebophrya sp. A120]|nr:unnamed protein product [Amoebophrya sp. A120]|eukprot:GSA120T00006475001.1